MKADVYEDEFEEFSAIATAFNRRCSLPLATQDISEKVKRTPRRSKSMKTHRKRKEIPTIKKQDPVLTIQEDQSSVHNGCTLMPPSPNYGQTSQSAPQSRSGSWRKSHRPSSCSLSNASHRERATSLTTEKIVDLFIQNSDSDICPIRSFKTSSKGLINRGDSFKYKSNISVASSLASNLSRTSSNNNFRNIEDIELTNNEHSGSSTSTTLSENALAYSVLLLGHDGVGKTTTARQFLTSEHIGSIEAESENENQRCVSVLLNGEESTISICDVYEHEDYRNYGDVDAYLVVYSITDKASYEYAVDIIHHIRRTEQKHVAVILVANKGDLVRFRQVSHEEAREEAARLDCKFIEVSASLNIKIDELLVGLVQQIKLNPDRDEKRRREIICKRKETTALVVQKLARNLLAKIFRNNLFGPSKSCDNLMIL